MTDGLLLVDKPYGITSFDVVHKVRRYFPGRRVGHAGTLDPLATGLLPVLIGRATPLLRFLPSEPKVYRLVARFGVATSSGDAECAPVAITDPGIAPPPCFEDALQSLTGEVHLKVPRYAAVKVDGRPLYKYSREGKNVAIPTRAMLVHRLSADPTGWPWVLLEMSVGGGTYVRAIVESLGERCGLPAHVASLRRLSVGPWTLSRACTIPPWESGVPPADAFVALSDAMGLPQLQLDPENSRHVSFGRLPERVKGSTGVRLLPGDPFLFVDSNGSAIAVAKSLDGWEDAPEPPRFQFERVLQGPE